MELSDKEVAAAWGISKDKASQTFNHWIEKLILLCRAHPPEMVSLFAAAIRLAVPATVQQPMLPDMAGDGPYVQSAPAPSSRRTNGAGSTSGASRATHGLMSRSTTPRKLLSRYAEVNLVLRRA